MLERLAERITGNFKDELAFFRSWVNDPKAIGSVWPTGAPLARKLASVVNPRSDLPVLEIGPGTGTITKAILATGIAPEQLWTVEYSAEFCLRLQQSFPQVHVVHGDAFDLDATLGDASPAGFDCAISALPLLNFPLPLRKAFVNQVLDRLPPGRPLIQFSYGPKSPAPPGFADYTTTHFGMVLRNVPPAQIWVYARGG